MKLLILFLLPLPVMGQILSEKLEMIQKTEADFKRFSDSLDRVTDSLCYHRGHIPVAYEAHVWHPITDYTGFKDDSQFHWVRQWQYFDEADSSGYIYTEQGFTEIRCIRCHELLNTEPVEIYKTVTTWRRKINNPY